MKIAKEDFHQLTQCCDNCLFMKKKLHANIQSERLAEKVFFMTKDTEKVGKGHF